MKMMQEMQVQSLSQKGHLEYEMATHSSILAWKIPWTEELGGFSPGDHEESNVTEQLSVHTHTHTQNLHM